jgi:hypothetical protein
MTEHDPHPLKAGIAYFVIIFAAGFALGTARVLWLAPLAGEAAAMLAELPVMLTASWLAARWLVRRYDVRARRDRAAMGGLGFALLMGAELALAVAAFGQDAGEWLTALFAMPGVIGLAGQVLFGAMPLWVRRG